MISNLKVKTICFFVLSLVLLTLISENESGENPEEILGRWSEDSIWPMFHRDPGHGGRSPYYTGDNPGKLRWRFRTGNSVRSSPAIAQDRTIYVGSDDGNLYAINPNGTLGWRFKTGDSIWSSPAIGYDGTVYVGSNDGNLYAINPNGTLRWRFKTNGSVRSSPAIAQDRTIYVGSDDGNLYAINPNGTLKWKFETGDAVVSSPAIDRYGRIYVGSNRLYAINSNGTIFWKLDVWEAFKSSPAIAADGTIYVGSGDGSLYAVDTAGGIIWRFKTDDFITSSPAIAADGTVYVGSRDGNLYAIGPYGTLKWKFDAGQSVWWSSPAIAAEVTVYVGGYDGNLYAINPNGTLRWRFKTGDSVWSSPAIGPEGAIYAGSNDGNLYSIWKSVPSPPLFLRANTGKGYVNLSWSPPADDGGIRITEYRIYRGTSPGAEEYVASVIGSVTSYHDIVPSALQDYYYYVVAVNDMGESEKSTEAKAKPGTPPSPPEGLKAELRSDGINLTWEPPKDDGGSDIVEYRIYRGKEEGGESYLVSVDASMNSYKDTEIERGTTYYYYIKAVNDLGESEPSNEVRVDTGERAPSLWLFLGAFILVAAATIVIFKRGGSSLIREPK